MEKIFLENVERFTDAIRLRKNGTFIINQGDYKNKEVYLTAPTDAMREKLANSVDFLFQLRCHALMNPIAPRADLDKYADRLERTIEKYFTQSTPDQRMQRVMGTQGPLILLMCKYLLNSFQTIGNLSFGFPLHSIMYLGGF